MVRFRWPSRLLWVAEKVELTLSLLHQQHGFGQRFRGGPPLIALVAGYYLAGLIHRIQLIRATSKFEPIIVSKDQDFIWQIEHQLRLFNPPPSSRRRSIPQSQGNDPPNEA
jgi:hypothetical protein